MNIAYKDYLTAPRAVTLAECERMHQEILSGMEGDDDAKEIYDNLIETAAEYARIRTYWTTKDLSWRMSEDPRRTATHDGLISRFNMLSRYLKSIGKSNSWREELGYEEEDTVNRKRIGDFGCYLAFVHALNGR